MTTINPWGYLDPAGLAAVWMPIDWPTLLWVRAGISQLLHRKVHTVTGHQVVLRPDAPTLAKVSTSGSLDVLHCAGCHGFDGQGAYSAKVSDSAVQRSGQSQPSPAAHALGRCDGRAQAFGGLVG